MMELFERIQKAHAAIRPDEIAIVPSVSSALSVAEFSPGCRSEAMVMDGNSRTPRR